MGFFRKHRRRSSVKNCIQVFSNPAEGANSKKERDRVSSEMFVAHIKLFGPSTDKDYNSGLHPSTRGETKVDRAFK
jgi:hypothetical protein